jgi:hypothetical protein
VQIFSVLLAALRRGLDPGPAAPDPVQVDALKSAIDFIKVSTGLATGALVFSLGLLDRIAVFPLWGRYVLGGTWALLAVSIVLGLFAQSTLPPKLAEQDLDILDDQSLLRPAQWHEILLMAAIAALGVALLGVVAEPPLAVASGSEAVALARRELRPPEHVSRLAELSLVAAADAGGSPTWRIQFELAPPAAARADVLVRAKDGKRLRVD